MLCLQIGVVKSIYATRVRLILVDVELVVNGLSAQFTSGVSGENVTICRQNFQIGALSADVCGLQHRKLMYYLQLPMHHMRFLFAPETYCPGCWHIAAQQEIRAYLCPYALLLVITCHRSPWPSGIIQLMKRLSPI